MNKFKSIFFSLIFLLAGCNGFDDHSETPLTDPINSFSFDMLTEDEITRIKMTLVIDEELVLKTNNTYLLLENNSEENVYLALDENVDIFAVSGQEHEKITEVDNLDTIVSSEILLIPGRTMIFSVNPNIPPNIHPDEIIVLVWGSTEKGGDMKNVRASINYPYVP